VLVARDKKKTNSLTINVGKEKEIIRITQEKRAIFGLGDKKKTIIIRKKKKTEIII